MSKIAAFIVGAAFVSLVASAQTGGSGGYIEHPLTILLCDNVGNCHYTQSVRPSPSPEPWTHGRCEELSDHAIQQIRDAIR